ncbi:Spy/CpxP family protein refolding chaperone [Ancylobacter defluvii]|uniref:LTXXQ motif family protein n=1 Tax=Ancylobacter defluvii TaxID=1282440 RepID=A0A9W6N988_9HYPH|nr:Spy/CpxP family protein refolding chaperone [Ancylobacter defluvii]GLK82227.1 hypothetical protein GCM10017653_02960 [Ancylobacter defluvii]
MKRTILAATAAALLASVTFGIAAPNLRAGGPERPSPEQMAANAAAMSDARIAALKAGLKLTPDQEKLWPALETALGDYSKERIEVRKEWREKREAQRDQRRAGPPPGAPAPQADAGSAAPPPPPGGPAPQADAGPAGPDRDLVARLEQRADRMVARGTALKQLAEAAAPLYQSLDEAQKHRFNVLFREAQGERLAEWRRDRHHGPQRGHGWEHGDRREFGRPPHGGPGMPPPGGPDAGPQRL